MTPVVVSCVTIAALQVISLSSSHLTSFFPQAAGAPPKTSATVLLH